MAHQRLRVLVGSLAPGVLPATQPAKLPAGTILLDLGPEHPSGAGLIELRLWTENDVITTARVVVGAMHRGAEKLFEVRDYRQILMLADRHDWQAPFFGELVVALVCEQMMGLAVPERAVWLRTLLAEHTKEDERGRAYAAHFALTHACWLVTYPAIGHAAARWGAPATFTWAGVACLLIAGAALALGRGAGGAHLHNRTIEET